jgi:hypothetical protein
MKLGVFGAMLAAIHLNHEPRPKHTKSKKYLWNGACLRKCHPSARKPRKNDHRYRSGGLAPAAIPGP